MTAQVFLVKVELTIEKAKQIIREFYRGETFRSDVFDICSILATKRDMQYLDMCYIAKIGNTYPIETLKNRLSEILAYLDNIYYTVFSLVKDYKRYDIYSFQNRLYIVINEKDEVVGYDIELLEGINDKEVQLIIDGGENLCVDFSRVCSYIVKYLAYLAFNGLSGPEGCPELSYHMLKTILSVACADTKYPNILALQILVDLFYNESYNYDPKYDREKGIVTFTKDYEKYTISQSLLLKVMSYQQFKELFMEKE